MNNDNIDWTGVSYNFDGDTIIGDYTVTIGHDTEPSSPRDWDNLGTMVCWHDQYDLGDKHGYETPRVFMHMISGLYPEVPTEELTDEQTARCHKVANKQAIILPLYLYDHSGITMRAEPFSCVWDSGMVGYIYISLAKARAEFMVSRITAKLREHIVEGFINEVKQYDQYLTGDIYGYTVVKNGNDEEVHVDGCWGFYGGDRYMLDCIHIAIVHDIERTPQQRDLI